MSLHHSHMLIVYIVLATVIQQHRLEFRQQKLISHDPGTGNPRSRHWWSLLPLKTSVLGLHVLCRALSLHFLPLTALTQCWTSMSLTQHWSLSTEHNFKSQRMLKCQHVKVRRTDIHLITIGSKRGRGGGDEKERTRTRGGRGGPICFHKFLISNWGSWYSINYKFNLKVGRDDALLTATWLWV